MLTEKERQTVSEARALIGDKRRWMRDEYAATRRGRTCQIDDRSAYKFCAVGALAHAALRACGGDVGRAHVVAHEIECKLLGDDHRYLHVINDRADGHAAVLRIFDTALALNARNGEGVDVLPRHASHVRGSFSPARNPVAEQFGGRERAGEGNG
jgi:hypothetical protein